MTIWAKYPNGRSLEREGLFLDLANFTTKTVFRRAVENVRDLGFEPDPLLQYGALEHQRDEICRIVSRVLPMVDLKKQFQILKPLGLYNEGYVQDGTTRKCTASIVNVMNFLVACGEMGFIIQVEGIPCIV